MVAEQQHELLSVERGNGFKAAVSRPDSAGGNGVDMGMEVQAGSVTLHRDDDTRQGGRIGGDLPEHLLDGLPGRFAEQAEVFRMVFEDWAEKLGDRKNILVVADLDENASVEPFGEQQDALLLT